LSEEGATMIIFLVSALSAVEDLPASPASIAPSARNDASATGGFDDADTAADIVVTARRREERLQDVPVAVSVISGDMIDQTGSYNVSRLVQIQPSLTFYSTNPRNSAANIRGLGAPFGLTNDGIEQGVGIYVDQVYYSRIASATFDFLDVERMEILRGPQGTLYGKNTTAGAINITTRTPTFDFEGRVELSYGNLDFVQAKASVSGPIIEDKLAFRLVGSGTHRRGTIFNVTSDKWVNEQGNIGFRGQLMWRTTENLDIMAAADFNRQNPECCAQIFVRTGLTQRALNRQYWALAEAFDYAPPSTDAFDRRTDLDADLHAEQELGGVSLQAVWNTGSGTLTSVTAWRYWDWNPSNDRDFTGLPITTISANPSHQDQYTQELRYSAATEKLDYVVGLFAFHQTLNTSGVQEQGPAASRWLLGPSGTDPSVLDGLRSENDISFENTSAAAFGQVGWRPKHPLRLQLGVRLNYDKKSGSYVATVTNGSGTPLTPTQRGQLAPQSYDPRFSDWNLSYDATASYELAADVMAYATYARSFKSGGINLSGLPLIAINQPRLSAATVEPERVNHFEIGLKSELFDRRLIANVAGFWTVIEDYQATVTNGQLGVLRGYLANADKVRVRGIELELQARPARPLSLYFNGAFTDHEYVRFEDAPCPPEPA
jgi:iron complex outermembrane receptor protein